MESVRVLQNDKNIIVHSTKDRFFALDKSVRFHPSVDPQQMCIYGLYILCIRLLLASRIGHDHVDLHRARSYYLRNVFKIQIKRKYIKTLLIKIDFKY